MIGETDGLKIELIGNIVYLQVDQDCDGKIINYIFSEVGRLTEELPQWVLYEQLGSDAGISTSGIEILFERYSGLQALGCVAIATESENFYADIIQRRKPPEITIAHKLSPNRDELHSFIHLLLKKPNDPTS